MAPTISSPLRILVLAAPDAPLPTFLKDPSHHEIRTAYYSASIPIWRDVLPLSAATITAFRADWESSEAAEVVQAVGAWILCFKKPRKKEDLAVIQTALKTIHEIIEHHAESSYSTQEPLLLAVGTRQLMNPNLEIGEDEWDEMCRQCGGWEWIDGEVADEMVDEGKGSGEQERNEFGEKVGIPRLKEALEAQEWESGDAGSLSDELELGSEDGFGAEAAELEREVMGLKMAARGEDGVEEGSSDGVEELENMMLKVRAIKDMGADMPEAEKKRFAAKAVKEVMKSV